jgi:high-affinity Fe2+/Pb2+ permease
MKHNKKTKWIDKAVWVMLLAYIIGILYLYIVGKQANLFIFLNTMTLLFILGMLIAVAYMIAMREQ